MSMSSESEEDVVGARAEDEDEDECEPEPHASAPAAAELVKTARAEGWARFKFRRSMQKFGISSSKRTKNNAGTEKQEHACKRMIQRAALAEAQSRDKEDHIGPRFPGPRAKVYSDRVVLKHSYVQRGGMLTPMHPLGDFARKAVLEESRDVVASRGQTYGNRQ